MKRNFKLLCTFSLIFFTIFSFSLSALGFENETEENEEILTLLASLEASSSVSTEPKTHSKHIIAIDRNSGRVLYEKNAYSQTPMASTTKILTAIIALEQCELRNLVNISSKAAHTSGSTLGIYENSQMTMRDLLYGLMLRSRQ